MPLVLDGTNGVSGVDGTASNPAIEGTDSNTGIFYPAADTVAIGTGGTEALRVDSSQRLGVGTTSTLGNSLVNVAQGVVARNSGATLPYFQTYNSNAGTDLKTWRFGGNSSGALTFETVNDAYSSATGRMTLSATSNLGVGTTDNDLASGAGAGVTAKISSTSGSGYGATNVNTGTGAYSVFQLGNSIAVNRAGFALTSSAYTASGLVRQDGVYMYTSSAGGITINVESAQPLYFGTSNTERARITSDGNFLVGTTDSSTASGNGCKILPNGKFGAVGTTAALSDTYNYYNSTAGAYRFYVTSAGVINATSTTITAISDQRLKENIEDIDVGLDAVMALKPRKFDWKEGKGKDKKGDRGWIAQEFEQVFPDMISTWKDEPPEGEEPYKAVNADLIPVLVKAIQELNAKVEAQAAEIAALKAQP